MDAQTILRHRLQDRERARTDLFWLAKEVLQYKDIELEVHGPIIANLQQFPGGGQDKYNADTLEPLGYLPKIGIWDLKGPRRRLFLDPRGHLKTTIITISHSIQWIINYYDIRILLSTAIGDQVTRIVSEIKAHFQWNEKFRYLFPEVCPPARRIADFGSMDQFIIPARQRKWLKEPTLSACSVGKVIAGGHYEVIIHSDLVDKENIKTPNQIQEVVSHFGYMNPLLERGPVPPFHGWTYVEGTRYDFSDLYGRIMDSEDKKSPAEREWKICRRGAIKPDGTTLWPTRFPYEELESIRNDPTVGDVIFSAQYLNDPIPASGGLATPDQIKFIPRSVLNELMPRLRIHTTIDLHGMEENDTGDFTVLTTAGFDADGRCYILDIRRGRFTPFQVIDKIFWVYQTFRPIDFKIEKDAHARVLLPFLARAMEKRRQFPCIIPIQRDNRTSKKQRIRGLQPWFETGIIRFAEDIICRLDLIVEVTRFPKFRHDDILDTLADQLQNRDGGYNYDILPGYFPPQIPIPRPQDCFLGFDPLTKYEKWLLDPPGSLEENYHKMTGL